MLWNGYLTIRMKRKLRKAVLYRDNIFECDNIASPFVMGVFRPRIYIPFRLGEGEREYILKHEQYHIKRKDYLVKIVAFLLVTVYWFQPLAWVSYFFMIRDMEMSCDEHVLGTMGKDIRRAYSKSLLGFAMNRRQFSMGLLAFGETNTKRRVKNVMNFKNDKKWMGILTIVLLVVVGVVCLTDAKAENEKETTKPVVSGSAVQVAKEKTNVEVEEKKSVNSWRFTELGIEKLSLPKNTTWIQNTNANIRNGVGEITYYDGILEENVTIRIGKKGNTKNIFPEKKKMNRVEKGVWSYFLGKKEKYIKLETVYDKKGWDYLGEIASWKQNGLEFYIYTECSNEYKDATSSLGKTAAHIAENLELEN